MTITSLDTTTALVVIDLQKGITAAPTVHPVGDIIARSADLAAAFRARGLPVVLVTVEGGAPGRTERQRPTAPRAADWADLLPGLDGEGIRIVKRTWGAFTATGLHDELAARGVTQVVLAGIATSMGVESTARAAHELGYNVALAVDAMTDRTVEAHENSVERIFPSLGETGSSAEIIALLASGDAQAH
jgi:nicotinamidase-related amidase